MSVKTAPPPSFTQIKDDDFGSAVAMSILNPSRVRVAVSLLTLMISFPSFHVPVNLRVMAFFVNVGMPKFVVDVETTRSAGPVPWKMRVEMDPRTANAVARVAQGRSVHPHFCILAPDGFT